MPSSLLQSFLPWILYFVIAGSGYFTHTVAAGAALVTMFVVSRQNLRKKFIIDWATLLYFAALFILLPFYDRLSDYAFLISNIFIALIMWISILVKHPFTLQYAREEVDPIVALTPTFKQINYAISTVWVMALSLMALDGLLQSFQIIASNLVADAIIAVLLIFAIWFTRWYPDWYQGFLFRRFSKNLENIAENPFLNGNYAPVKDTVSLNNLPIEGELPKNLNGMYMRNGSNPAFHPISYTYPLDGDSMIHAIYIANGKANYRNRFVETKGLTAERRAGRALYGGIANPIPVDPKLIGKEGDPGPIKDGAFIHIIRHAEKYLALWESGPAYEVTEQLQTIEEWCPQGAKPPFNVNAHTRLDPDTGALFAFTYDFQPPYLQYYVLNKDGELTQNSPIDKSTSSMMHDFVLTENYVVFFDCPAVFDLKRMAKGEGLLQWQPELGVRIGVVNRKTQKVVWIETEPFFVFHFANGYEQDQKIIINYVRHVSLMLGSYTSKIPPQLYQTIIDLKSNTAVHQQLNDRPVEFPRINDRFNTKYNRYIYIPTETREGEFNALIKYDLERHTEEIHDFGKNAEIGEAVFAPNNSATSEDDGYVMLFVYNKKENKSDFVVLHAQDFAGNPVARIKLPRRVPHGLHGSWMPESEKRTNRNQIKNREIEPPWIKQPDFGPGDFFWRDAGNLWFSYVWLPYWESLNEDEKQKYLERWYVPDEWRLYSEYINSELRAEMDRIDNDE